MITNININMISISRINVNPILRINANLFRINITLNDEMFSMADLRKMIKAILCIYMPV